MKNIIGSGRMSKPRWMIERKYERNRELLQIVEVYAESENKETVKRENRRWTHKRYLIKQ